MESLGAPWAQQWCALGCASRFHGHFQVNREVIREMSREKRREHPGFCSGDSLYQHCSSFFFLNSVFLIFFLSVSKDTETPEVLARQAWV